MKTNIKLFVIFLVIVIAVLHLIVYYVTGHIPNDVDGRSGMVVATVMAIVIISALLGMTDEKDKKEILDTITCAKDKLIEEECEKDTK